MAVVKTAGALVDLDASRCLKGAGRLTRDGLSARVAVVTSDQRGLQRGTCDGAGDRVV